MSENPQFRIRNVLQIDGKEVTLGSEAITKLIQNADGNVLFATGATVPTDATAGYAKGCIFLQSDGGAGTTTYTNEGDETSCDFNVGLATGDITGVTAGAGLTGGGTTGALTLDVVADESSIEVTADEIHVKAEGINASHLSAASAVTATADGLTTGIIPATARHVTVTSDSADKIVTLPASVVGKEITMYVGATGCEVRTTAGSNIKINNVDADGTNEAAIPATTLARFVCVSATEWILTAVDELGAVVTAIVPDAA